MVLGRRGTEMEHGSQLVMRTTPPRFIGLCRILYHYFPPRISLFFNVISSVFLYFNLKQIVKSKLRKLNVQLKSESHLQPDAPCIQNVF